MYTLLLVLFVLEWQCSQGRRYAMHDVFSPYEYGITRLLATLFEESLRMDALLLQTRLERCICEARRYRYGEAQASELNKVVYDLNYFSMRVTEKNFNDWCEIGSARWRESGQESRADEGQRVEYVAAFYNGELHQKVTEAFVAKGARPNARKQDAQEDVLERYLAVPLHALFLYTSQDPGIERYILDHWGALDSLSGSMCDIYPLLDQFEGVENAYDYLEHLSVLKPAGCKRAKLPGLFFWDNEGNYEDVPFGYNADSSTITYILRVVFDEIAVDRSISSVTRAKRLVEGERELRSRFPGS